MLFNIFGLVVLLREVYSSPLGCVCSDGEVLWQPEGAFGSEQLEHESGGEQSQRNRPVSQIKQRSHTDMKTLTYF